MMDEAGKAYDKMEECETSDNVGGKWDPWRHGGKWGLGIMTVMTIALNMDETGGKDPSYKSQWKQPSNQQ